MACHIISVLSIGLKSKGTRSRIRSIGRPKVTLKQTRAHRSSVGLVAATPSWLSGDVEDAPDAITDDAPLRVLISGGGLGGLFAAISLRDAGMEVIVVERTAVYAPLEDPYSSHRTV